MSARLQDGTWILAPTATTAEAIAELLDEVRRRGGGPVRWVVSDPTAASDAVARTVGLVAERDLPQLRRRLPVADDDRAPAAPTRAFRPGSSDEAAWVDANNRTFAEHPDQSGFTLERLHRRMAEPWFDPDGFRLHEVDGELAGFCWTRRHPPTGSDPELGEIYAIGVHPDHQGHGLGRALVLAGLDWLADQGVRTAMLYTESTNAAALGLYHRLGFTEHHRDRLYEAAV